MRRAYAIVILLCIVYFLGGWVAVLLGWLPKAAYFSYAGIVGGVASVAGLLSFTRPPLTNSDLRELELDSLKSVTRTSEDLQVLERRRAETENELEALDVQKKEMELLVRKASLSLFLREQYSYYERQVAEEVRSNSELRAALGKLQEVTEKLSALNEEIEADPNVQQLREVISSAGSRGHSLDEALSELPPVTRALFHFLRAWLDAMANLAKALR